MPTQQHSRIDLADLKGQIVKTVGSDRAQRYFSYLNRLLSQKLGKAEFDKLSYLTLGRENLPLHNQLIRSILTNACHGRVPPPIPEKFSESASVLGKRSPSKEDGCLPEGATSPSQIPYFTLPLGSNEDVWPSSLRKVQSGIHDQRPRDLQSKDFGSNVKADFVSQQERINEEALVQSVVENGNLYSRGLRRPMQHHQELAEQPAGSWDVSLPPPNKRSRIKRSPHEQFPAHSKAPGEVISVENAREVKQNNSANSNRIALQAPLGIPFCPASMGEARRAFPVASSSSSSSVTSFIDSGELSDRETLRKRMEQIAGAAGLDGVSLDCANFLNNGLDMYLKRLIRSCIELVGARTGHKLIKQSFYKHQLHEKLTNGVTPGHQMYSHSSDGSQCLVSFMDFKVAMELNPQQLGEDWPSLIEKLCLRAYKG